MKARLPVKISLAKANELYNIWLCQKEDEAPEENFRKRGLNGGWSSMDLAYEDLTKGLPFQRPKGKFASSSFWKMFGVSVIGLNLSLVVKSQSLMVIKCPFTETKVPPKRYCPLQ